MKTRQPLILTAHIEESDLQPFDLLRQAHFPPDRNVLQAHLTMFYRLPGEYLTQAIERLQVAIDGKSTIVAEVSGVRHMGAGVAFTIASAQLHAIHEILRKSFVHWLGPQDMQKWQPHITIQNKVSRAAADGLYRQLVEGFKPSCIRITGVDLWRYMSGPWVGETSLMFGSAPGRSED